jgi:hypothetical protein
MYLNAYRAAQAERPLKPPVFAKLKFAVKAHLKRAPPPGTEP